MPDDDAINRLGNKAPDRQASVGSRWNIVEEGKHHVRLDASGFLHNGEWDRSEMWNARLAFHGKQVEFEDPGSRTVYLEKKHLFDERGITKEAQRKLGAFQTEKTKVLFYEMPSLKPGKGKEFVAAASPQRLTNLSKDAEAKVVKIDSAAEKAKRDAERAAKRAASAKGSFGERLGELDKQARKSTKEWDNAEGRRWKAQHEIAAARAKMNAEPKGSKPSKRTILRDRIRASMAADAELAQRRRQFAKETVYAVNQAKDVVRRQKKDRDPVRNKLKRERRMDRNVGAFSTKLRNLPGFGSTPVKMLANRFGLSGNLPGKKRVMDAMSHGEKYPARRLSSAVPFKASATGRQSISSLDLDRHPGNAPMRGSHRGEIFTTANTRLTSKFPDGGSGIMFKIDATTVIENLLTRYPAAIRAASIEAGERVGRRMLDIVEPYVPKDTGLLYMSGETNAEQMGAGGVDIEGGEAYASGQMFGVSISYNAPYAELVYFDESKRHGAAYNQEYGTAEKDDRETARWIEVAFQKERGALSGLLSEYSSAITAAMNVAGGKIVAFTRSSGKSVSFFSKG